MVDWCRAKVSHLIDKFREHPILWDVRCVDERNKNRKAEALEEISRSLHVPIEEVIKKLHSLKVQFSREFCRVRREKQKTGRNYVPKWYGYEQLLFLKDANTRIHRKSLALEDPDEYSSFLNSNSDDLSVISVNSIKEERESPVDDDEKIAMDENRHSMPNENGPSMPIENGSSLPIKRKLNDSMQSGSSNLQDSHIYIPTSSNSADEFTTYGLYIASKLKSINDPYLQALAKHNLNRVIFNIELKQLQRSATNPPNENHFPDFVP